MVKSKLLTALLDLDKTNNAGVKGYQFFIFLDKLH